MNIAELKQLIGVDGVSFEAIDGHVSIPVQKKHLLALLAEAERLGLLAAHNYEEAVSAQEKEGERWAQRFDWLHTEYEADCSGVDSGDPLDCVEVEMRQVINRLEGRVANIARDVFGLMPAGDDFTTRTYNRGVKDALGVINMEMS